MGWFGRVPEGMGIEQHKLPSHLKARLLHGSWQNLLCAACELMVLQQAYGMQPVAKEGAQLRASSCTHFHQATTLKPLHGGIATNQLRCCYSEQPAATVCAPMLLQSIFFFALRIITLAPRIMTLARAHSAHIHLARHPAPASAVPHLPLPLPPTPSPSHQLQGARL